MRAANLSGALVDDLLRSGTKSSIACSRPVTRSRFVASRRRSSVSEMRCSARSTSCVQKRIERGKAAVQQQKRERLVRVRREPLRASRTVRSRSTSRAAAATRAADSSLTSCVSQDARRHRRAFEVAPDLQEIPLIVVRDRRVDDAAERLRRVAHAAQERRRPLARDRARRLRFDEEVEAVDGTPTLRSTARRARSARSSARCGRTRRSSVRFSVENVQSSNAADASVAPSSNRRQTEMPAMSNTLRHTRAARSRPAALRSTVRL